MVLIKIPFNIKTWNSKQTSWLLWLSSWIVTAQRHISGISKWCLSNAHDKLRHIYDSQTDYGYAQQFSWHCYCQSNMSVNGWTLAAVFWWHQEMYAALIDHLYGSCKAWHFDRVLRVMPVEGGSSVYDACVYASLCVWFVPTICSKQMNMPGCAFMCTLSMCFTTSNSRAFHLCGFSSFHSLPCSFSKKGIALRPELRQVRWHDSVGRHWDSSVWLTLLVTLSQLFLLIDRDSQWESKSWQTPCRRAAQCWPSGTGNVQELEKRK